MTVTPFTVIMILDGKVPTQDVVDRILNEFDPRFCAVTDTSNLGNPTISVDRG